MKSLWILLGIAVVVADWATTVWILRRRRKEKIQAQSTHSVPSEIAKLTVFLESHGFSQVADKGPDLQHFGNRILVYKSQYARVRVILDRGIWQVEIGDAHGKAWYDVPLICEYLMKTTLGDVVPLSSQVETLTKHWAVIAEGFQSGDLQGKLEALREIRFKTRFGDFIR